MKGERCALCSAEHALTFHHLIPRTLHKNKWFRKQFSLCDMRERGIVVCRRCHTFIHKQFSEKQLGREYNSLELLKSSDVVQRHIVWAKKQASRRT